MDIINGTETERQTFKFWNRHIVALSLSMLRLRQTRRDVTKTLLGHVPFFRHMTRLVAGINSTLSFDRPTLTSNYPWEEGVLGRGFAENEMTL